MTVTPNLKRREGKKRKRARQKQEALARLADPNYVHRLTSEMVKAGVVAVTHEERTLLESLAAKEARDHA